MFERAAAPHRPDARRRAETATAAPQVVEAANEPRLGAAAPATPEAAPEAASTLPRYLRGGQPDEARKAEGPEAREKGKTGESDEKAAKEEKDEKGGERLDGDTDPTPEGRDAAQKARAKRKQPGARAARKPGTGAGREAGEGREGAAKAPGAQGKPAAAKAAPAGGAVAAGAGAASAGATAAGPAAAAGGGGSGGAPLAAGAEAEAEGAEAETEEKLDAAEAESETDEAGEDEGAAAPEVPVTTPAAAGGGAPAAEAPAPAEPPEAETGDSDSEAPAPEPVASPPPAAAGAAPADPDTQAREQAQADRRDEQADAERVAQHTSESREEDQAESDADGGDAGGAGGAEAADIQLAGPEREAALGSLGEELPAEGGAAGGGGGGGGGGETKADETPPDVAGLPPEQGLATLAEATPAQADAALGGVAASAAAESAAQTAEVQAALPEPTLGEPAGAKPVAPKAGTAAGNTPKESAPGAAPKAEVKPTPEPAKGNAADKVPRPEIPKPAEGAEPSAAQKSQLASAISALPGSDPGLGVRLGSAPKLALSGAADPAQMAAQKAQADQAVALARQREAAEVARPLGEQDVRPTVGIAQIKARVLKPAGGAAGGGGGGGAAAGGGGGGAAAGGDKARGILAEELKGPEVRAAMAAASAKAAAAKAEAQAKVAAGNAAAEARIGELKTQAAADQEAARAKVRADAAAARNDYAVKQEAAVTKLEKSQQDTLDKTQTQVEDRKREGDEAAQAQIEEGDLQVADKQAEVESQVEGKKQEVQQASEEKGFFGRLADSVGAWFDRAKQWISEKVEAGKKWIKDTADRFKKYAAEKIDAARDAVTGLIKDAGAALIAVSDAVLSEFPAARDAVRGAIESGVEWGVEKTNQIAEGAKNTVNKVVDGAAAVAEGALEIGGKAVNAALDGAKATAVGALNAADKAAQALGVLKILVEDVASNPGGWIANLGGGARDGVANHLAAAMKAAIKQWWEGKLESVLGVGPAIWATLKKGGLGLKEIGAMAWSAIKAAIPPALIQLIIEKVVAMIIPAAGAVLAIIEGLQAAWGSVSAMLGAVGKAIAFLKAVKGGGAGPQFAALVAAAAIVVIDFVSNWLLARLGKAILKIGGKIKGIAQKLMRKISGAVKKAAAKRKAKGRVKARARKKKDKAARDRKAKKLREQRKARGKDKDPAKKDDPGKKKQAKEKAKRDRLAKAVAAIEPALRSLVAGGVGKARLWLQVQGWKLRHRLTQLSVQTGGGQLRLTAAVNPKETFGSGLVFEGARLSVLIRQIVREELLSLPEVSQRAGAAPGAHSTVDSPVALAGQAMQTRGQFGQHGPGGLFNYNDWNKHQVHYKPQGGGPGQTITEGRALMGGVGAPMERIFVPGSTGSYPHLSGVALPGLMASTGMKDPQLGMQLTSFAQTGGFTPKGPGGRSISLADAQMMAATSHLLFAGESARSVGNLVTAPMTAQLTEQGSLTWQQALAPRASPDLHSPMALAGAPAKSRGLERQIQDETGIAPRAGPHGTVAGAEQMAASEENLVIAWVSQVSGGQVAAGSEESVRALVRRFVRDWYRLKSPSRRR